MEEKKGERDGFVCKKHPKIYKYVLNMAFQRHELIYTSLPNNQVELVQLIRSMSKDT
jgi:hypothetical protein